MWSLYLGLLGMPKYVVLYGHQGWKHQIPSLQDNDTPVGRTKRLGHSTMLPRISLFNMLLMVPVQICGAASSGCDSTSSFKFMVLLVIRRGGLMEIESGN